jgi:hypothetical protein
MGTKKNKPKKGRGRPPGSSRPRRSSGTPSGVDQSDSEQGQSLASFFDDAWGASRAGAISGRGYRYQDAVGSWLAIQAHVGQIAIHRVVPEGLEDVSCEGDDAWHVQVKSRQARVGDFPLGLAARHILDAWSHQADRRTRDPNARLAVVFERPIAGATARSWGVPVAEEDAWTSLVGEVRRLAEHRRMASDDLAALLAETTVTVLPWQDLEAEAALHVADATNLPPEGARTAVRAVQAALGYCANRNAQVGWPDRAGLSRTDVVRLVTDTAALIDRDALLEAVQSGACEVVDFESPLSGDAFYEGESTQPGHVVGGLVVARPSATDAVLAGLDDRRAVLVAGPSGIGKSAVVWMAAYVARHVVWYRVNRLREEDVEPLLRLARSSGAGRYGPVGFVVDGVGTGALSAWDALRSAVAAQPGVVLLGSVREEDALPLSTLGDCVVVRPRRDEELASRMHAELLERGSTAAEHWAEAFGRAGGLTLEYTHLLTQGRRLSDVVSDQLRARVRDRRDMELAVVGPVAMAHQWGASLDLGRLGTSIGAAEPELKAALARLVAEHLVTVEGTAVRGLHQLPLGGDQRGGARCPAAVAAGDGPAGRAVGRPAGPSGVLGRHAPRPPGARSVSRRGTRRPPHRGRRSRSDARRRPPRPPAGGLHRRGEGLDRDPDGARRARPDAVDHPGPRPLGGR